jgi:hypothetical protein
MVWQVLHMLAEGATPAEARAAFPTLTSAHISAALEYASAITRENHVFINTRLRKDLQEARRGRGVRAFKSKKELFTSLRDL